MSTIRSTHDGPTLAGTAIERDARALLGQVMGFVALTVGCAALGAYLGRDLSGAIGLLLFIPALALCVSIPNANLIYAVAGLATFGAFTIFDFNRLRRASRDGAVPIAASIFLDIFNVFLLFLGLFGGQRD
jgi:FtsH-binding integral membrane protein